VTSNIVHHIPSNLLLPGEIEIAGVEAVGGERSPTVIPSHQVVALQRGRRAPRLEGLASPTFGRERDASDKLRKSGRHPLRRRSEITAQGDAVDLRSGTFLGRDWRPQASSRPAVLAFCANASARRLP
jgi:hypothetical protein